MTTETKSSTSLLKDAVILQVIPRPAKEDNEKPHIRVEARHGSVSLIATYYLTKEALKFTRPALEAIFGKSIYEIATDPDSLSGTEVRYTKSKRPGTEYTDIHFYPRSNVISKEEVGALLSEC